MCNYFFVIISRFSKYMVCRIQLQVDGGHSFSSAPDLADVSQAPPLPHSTS